MIPQFSKLIEKKIFDEKDIRKIIFISLISLVSALSIIFAVFHISNEFKELDENLNSLEKTFIQNQKALLKSSVLQKIQLINLHRDQMRDHLMINLKSRVIEAKSISENLFYKNIFKIKSPELERITLQALRPIQFNQGRGYFFGLGLDGTLKLYPPDRTIENKSVYSIYKIGQMQQVFQDMTKLIMDKGEGFCEYDWPIPGASTGQYFKKISYISLLEPYNLFIGAGEYLKDFDRMTRNQVLKDIEAGIEKNSTDNFIIYQIHRYDDGGFTVTLILNPNRPDLIGKKISDDFSDARGNKFRKQILQDMRRDGETFITHWFKRSFESKPQKKISYFKFYPEWDWIVAKGTYLDGLEPVLNEKKDRIKEKMKKELVIFICFFSTVIFFVLTFAYFFTHGIKILFKRYKSIQERQRHELEILNKHLHHKATIDALTQIYNRNYFDDQLVREITRSERYNQALSLIIFDIDFFKKINDEFGHLSGDKILSEIAKLIGSQIRESDIFARWGGEEFVILIPETDKEAAYNVAKKNCLMIAEHKFPIDRQVTCSFGVTQYMPGEDITDFLDRADACLYDAKKSGRNKVVIC